MAARNRDFYLAGLCFVGERAEEALKALGGAQTLDVGQAVWKICK